MDKTLEDIYNGIISYLEFLNKFKTLEEDEIISKKDDKSNLM